MKPRVALLVPCYNASRFVAPFVAMVRAQTRPHDEVWFYDDASTDDTVAQLTAQGQRVLRGSVNGGAAVARNRLLAATAADYVHFHDIDDTLDPAFVATLLPAAAPDCAACCAFQQRLPDGTVQRDNRFHDLPPPAAGPRVAYFLEHFLHFNAVIYPRAAIERVGRFDERFRISEDVHLLLRLAADGLRYAYHDRVLTTWQVRPESTYHALGARGAARGILAVLEDLAGRWRDRPAPRSELAPELLEIAWRLKQLGEYADARRAAALAQACGARVIRNRGGRIRWLSRLLGPAGYYRFFAKAGAR